MLWRERGVHPAVGGCVAGCMACPPSQRDVDVFVSDSFVAWVCVGGLHTLPGKVVVPHIPRVTAHQSGGGEGTNSGRRECTNT